MTASATITVFGGGADFGLPEVSPYVTKTEIHLRMAGLPYRKERAMPDTSPKGQLPYIDDDGERIADSTFIRAHLERKYGVDFDAGLDVLQRAQAWTIERMVENHLSWACGYARWMLPENFEKGPAHFFDHAPEAIRAQLRDEVRVRVAATMRAVGIARHSPDEIVGLGERSLSALSLALGDKRYLFGAKPTGVDAVTFGVLAGLLTPFFESPLQRRAQTFSNLTAYVDRMMLRFFPEHPWAMA